MNAIMTHAVYPFVQAFRNGVEISSHLIAVGGSRKQIENGADNYNCIISIGCPPVQIVTVVSEFDELVKIAKELRLKGDEADIIHSLSNCTGTTSLANLAATCEWANPKKQYDDAAYRLNKKLKEYGWRLRREDGSAEAIRMPNPNRKAR